ncbi:FLYWCH-type zinc finger-containing protein 1-like [Cydia amplana]|uniref:FLYWCH-type zinc finger-containing protein 1-like n=1 Tax=Cydia amplana TaxID=1869771 RepID=UPI002FE5D6D7
MEKAVFTTSRRGKRLLTYNGYTYYAKAALSTYNHQVRWCCSTHGSIGCRATLYTLHNTVIHEKRGHNHPPHEAEFVTSRQGNRVLRLNGYSFYSDGTKIHNTHTRPVFQTTSRGGRMIVMGGYKFFRQVTYGPKTRWFCSGQGRGCKAVIFTVDDEIIDSKNEHNHYPPTKI